MDSYSSKKKVVHFTVYMSAKERGKTGRGERDIWMDLRHTRPPTKLTITARDAQHLQRASDFSLCASGASTMPHSERMRGRRSRRRVMNGRAVTRRSEFLKKLSKKMTVRSASTINKMGGKSYEIQTHSNNGHNFPLHQSTPPLGEMFSV